MLCCLCCDRSCVLAQKHDFRSISRNHENGKKNCSRQENVFESLPARDGLSSALFEKSKNLASSACGLRQSKTRKMIEQGEGMGRESQGSKIPTPRFAEGPGPLISYWMNYFKLS